MQFAFRRRLVLALSALALAIATPVITSAATAPGLAPAKPRASSPAPATATASIPGPAPATTLGTSSPAPATVFGASINATDDVARLSYKLRRQLTTVRVFLSSTPSSWSSNALLSTVPANGTVALSFHSGTPTQVTRFLSSRPKTLKCYATYWHEPEDNFMTATQKAAYRTNWHGYAPAIRQAGCKPTLILMKWSLNPKSGRNWQDWYPKGDIDVLAFDAYNTRAKIGTYGTPSQYLAPILAASTQTGLPWALTELASDIPAGTKATDRAAWAHGVAVAAASQPRFLFATWWDVLSNSGRDYRLDSVTAQAWHP